MKTANDLYMEANASSRDALIETTVKIHEDLMRAAKAGLYSQDILLCNHPILQQEAARNQFLTQQELLGFRTYVHHDPKYPTLGTITLSWGQLQ